MFDRYKKYAENNNHVMQVSYPRSGRVWVKSMVSELSGVPTVTIDAMQHGELAVPNMYLTSHTYGSEPLPIFSSARYVSLIRDPRDSLISFIYMFLKSGTYTEAVWRNLPIFREMAKRWRLHQECIADHNPHVIYYERMCIDPEAVLRQTLKAIGYELVGDMNATLNRFCSNSEYKDRCLKWQRDSHFTKDHNDVILDEVGDVMEIHGYTYYGHSDKLLEV